jgi:hypothetical protein
MIMRKILKNSFSTAADYLSTKNMKLFGVDDYPEALNYSRPFSKVTLIKISHTQAMGSQWRPSICLLRLPGYC